MHDFREIGILNSDRIVFNSRGADIFAYSSRDINLVSKNRIVLEGHKNVYLGSAPEQGKATGARRNRAATGNTGKEARIQPVLLGDTTMRIIENLMQALIEFSVTMQSAKGSVVDFVVPVSGIHEGCTGLQGTCEQLIEDLDSKNFEIKKTTNKDKDPETI